MKKAQDVRTNQYALNQFFWKTQYLFALRILHGFIHIEFKRLYGQKKY